ncbi:MAG TPA: hypothetical protein VGK13_05800 [Methanocellaceae archaeon]
MRLNTISAIVLIMALVASSGCVNKPEPAPSATPLTPTPMSSATDAGPRFPSTIGLIQSGQLTVEDVSVSYDRDAEKQGEVYSVLIRNNGFEWANNTIIYLRVIDAQTDRYYFGDQFSVGSIKPNESMWLNMSTGSHDYAFSELVNLDWFWGDNMEFRNSYSRTFSLAFIPYNS